MIKTIILGLYVLSATTTSNCADGCLKCDSSACRLCDFTLGYTLSGSSCAKITLDNCITMNQRGACLTCDSNYYLDSSTSKCIAVATNEMVQNCNMYSSPNTCIVCKTGFYLSNSACVSIDTPISNCDIQSSSGKCLICKSDYYLSLDSTACTAGSSGDNCASYTNIECSSCSSGYIKNFNYYLYQISNLSSPSFESDVTNFILDNVNSNIDGKDVKVCQSVQVSNCDSYETFNTCNICSSGYYLNNSKQCVDYPFTTIVNCEVYSDLTTCSVCKPGFFMETANNCVEVPTVDKCAIYTNMDNGRDCEQCVEGYFLLSFNSCVPRKTPIIDNCVTLVANAEACELCNVGYRATDDGFKCMNIIPNCSVYEPSNALSTDLTCYKCSSGYYYDDSTKNCLAGTTPNCEIYEKTENVCSICSNKYYLEMDACKPHNILLNCDVYHPTLKNLCITCNPDTFLFENDNQCVGVNNIPNCASYKNRTACGQCNDGYYLANNSCAQIPVSENCLQRSGNLCGKCINDFILENGICKDSLDFMVNECETDNINGTVNYANSKCFTCKANTYPLNYKDSYMCVETSYMTLMNNNAALTTNCTHYAPLDNGSYECARCATNFYLDNGACVTSCSNAARATLYKQILKIGNTDGDKLNDGFYVYRINVCSTTITGCAIAAPNTVQKNIELIDYQCVQCNNGRIARIDFSANSTLISNPADTANPFGNSPITRVPGFECYDPTIANAKMVGDINGTTKNLSFCDYYKRWGPITGCTRCSFGYSGVVLDVVTQCAIYINDAYTCKQCNQGYFLASPYECKQVTQVDYCTLYSTTSQSTVCTQCVASKYLNGLICSQRSTSLNVLNGTGDVASDTVTCNSGYFKDTSSSPHKCVLMTPNCINGTMTNSTTFACNECDHTKSYLDTTSKLCITGSKTNCAIYNNTANLCVTCSNNYYLSNGSCIANTSGDLNCTTWSNSTKNTCTTCNNSSILFNVNNKCRNVTNAIPNCLAYDSLTTCMTCAPGTRLENLKTRCLTIPPADNCAISTVMNYNQISGVDVGDAPVSGPNAGIFYYTCDQCTNSTARFTRSNVTASNGSTALPKYECFGELSYKLGHCDTNTSTGVEDFAGLSCTSCSNGYYPQDWTNKYTCLEKTYFALKSANISSCERVEWNTGTSNYKCTRCTYPYFLQTNNTCGASCPASSYGVFSLFETATSSGVNYVRLEAPDSTCASSSIITSPVTNCEVYSVSSDYGSNICAKCKSGYLPVISYSSKTLLIDGYTTTTGRPASPISAHPSITSCDPVSYVTSDTATVQGDFNYITNLIPNCKYYSLLETVTGLSNNYVYGCVRCNYGFTGQILDYTHTISSDLIGYIKTCSAFTGTSVCDMTFTEGDNAIGLGLTTDYTNAHFGLTKYFSCLKCDTAGYIPFAFVSSDTNQYDIKQLNGYTIAATPDYNTDPVTSSDAENAVRCIEAYDGSNSPIISTSLLTSGDDFPQYCALGIVNVNSDKDNSNGMTTSVSTNGLAAYCVACMPGYKPVFPVDGSDVEYPHVVIECVAITDCTTPGTWFNSCQDCTHYYDIYTNTIDYTKCINTPPANCFSAYEVGPCVICKKGYDKDESGACVQEGVPVCAQPNMNRNYEYFFHSYLYTVSTTSAYFFGESEEVGCRACAADKILTKITGSSGTLYDANLSKYVCNDYKSALSTINSFLEPNCSTYGVVSGSYKCKSCNIGYILSEDYHCKHATIANCNLVKATDGYTCISCAVGYLNVGGKCHDVTTLVGNHCTAFDDSSALTYAKCNTCNDGYVLSAGGVRCDLIDTTAYPNCVKLTGPGGVCAKCSSLYALTTLASGVKFCYPLYSGLVAQFDANCLTINETLFNSSKQIECTSCNANYILESVNVNPTTCAAFYRGVTDNCATYYNTGALSTATLKCKTCTNVSSYYYKAATFECKARTVVTHCATYATEFNYCDTCSDNYVLSPDKLTCTALPGAILSPNRAPNGGYIQRCTAMATCSSKVVYSGLSTQLSSVFSCHKCANPDQIPLAVVRGGESFTRISGINEFGFNPTAGLRYDTAAGESSVTCVAPAYATFNIASNKWTFPQYCGAAILNANSVADASSSGLASNVDKTKIAVMCVACAPGYAATTATDATSTIVPFMVSSCAAIANCESSLWFSACSQCKSNYSYGYVSGVGVKYDRCISYSANPNCYAVDNSDVSNLKCKYCRKGYYLNRDGYCELLHPPRCAYGQFRFKQYYTDYNLGNGLFLSNDGIGCQQCDTGFVGLLNAASDRQACTQSPYITNGMVTASSNFIPYCLQYSVNNGAAQTCDTCQANYVLTVEGKCVINTAITNCALAYNNVSCFTCNDPYVLVNRKCVAGSITHCQSYANNEVYAAQVCITCDDGFYLQDNTCNEGSITNCQSYDNSNTCNVCYEGYGLVKSKNGIDYCYPIDASLNCSLLDYDSLQNGLLRCASCTSNNFIISNDQNLFNKTICMPFIAIDDCKTYDIAPNVQDSSFNCTSCNDAFYLEDGVCNIRSVQISECQQYSVTEDICLQCVDQYFLADNGTNCTAFPDGIAGCRIYLSKTMCFGCEANMFLKNNVCIAVEDSDQLDDCVYYDDPQTCAQCTNGHIVVDGKCASVSAQNCLTYENTNACDSCPAGYGLKLVSGLLNCVQNNIDNCHIGSEVEPFECLVCNTNYYVSAGICASVTTPITNCIQYAGASVCAVCDDGSVLSTDKLSCLKTTEILSVLDSNCQEAKLTADLLCNTCLPGYVFVNGVCSSCSTRTLAAGCYVCDPDNQNTCLMCAPGYYQYDDGRCVKNGLLPDEVPTTDPTTDSFVILKAMIAAIMLLIFS